MKKKKVAGIDGIPMEAWMYGSKAVKARLAEVMEKVWKEGELPKDWKTNIIVLLLYKKEENGKL